MATWAPLTTGSRSVRSVQAQTEVGPPDEGAGVGFYWGPGGAGNRIGWIVTRLTAPAGQTFTGSGDLLGWLYDPKLGLWTRAPRADEDLVDGAGLASFVLPGHPVGSPHGSFAWLCEGVGLSGAGGNVTVDMVCTTASGDPA